jgi:hypothetical protein
VVGAFECCDGFIQCRHNCRTGSFSRRTLLVKLVILPSGLPVSQSRFLLGQKMCGREFWCQDYCSSIIYRLRTVQFGPLLL